MALTKVIGAGAEGLTLSTTDLKIDSGDLLFGTSAKGVVVGATSNTDANTLDDYEEGTFTPSAQGASTAGTVSHSSTPLGRYTKIGKNVTVFMQLNFSLSGESGLLRITGLPFACSTNEEGIGTFQCNNMENSYESNVGHYNSVIQGDNDYIHFRGTKNNGGSYDNMAANNMEYMRVAITYPTG